MKLICAAAIIFSVPAMPLAAQERVGTPASVPIYSVTVVARTTKAINYEYRSGPTKIDFRGTVLLPNGKGDATVESQRGRTDIDVSLQNMVPPTQYGREYLTYTLWAITPEGAPHNLGEIIPGPSNKARLRVTTDLQAFGLIVTAEPYASAHQPSDVVVMENEVRPDTVGKIQTIDAKYELMPRGHYTWHVPDALTQAELANQGPKVSMDKYEEQLAIYEAQNAIGIAGAANAGVLAPNTMEKATMLLNQAEKMQAGDAPPGVVIQDAREATQTAEDARVIAERRGQAEKVAAAQQAVSQAREAQMEAQNAARQAQIDADAARAQSQADRIALQQAQNEAAVARQQAQQSQMMSAQVSPPPPAPVTHPAIAQPAEVRVQLLEQLNGVLPTLDSPRGLIVTVGNSDFNGAALGDGGTAMVARLGAVLAAHPHLHIDVEGYNDNASAGAISWGRAQTVQRILLSQGIPAGNIAARDLGDSRPLVSNSTPAGREQNRRVEIVISGAPLGTLPSWDRTYNLAPGR
jgi:outer membrane protein OmpA-like peptidoglycan-associated protein